MSDDDAKLFGYIDESVSEATHAVSGTATMMWIYSVIAETTRIKDAPLIVANAQPPHVAGARPVFTGGAQFKLADLQERYNGTAPGGAPGGWIMNNGNLELILPTSVFMGPVKNIRAKQMYDVGERVMLGNATYECIMAGITDVSANIDNPDTLHSGHVVFELLTP